MSRRRGETKSEFVAARMPPRLRHGLDVIARANGLTTTNAIAYVIRHFLQTKDVRTPNREGDGPETLEAVADATWASDEAGRFLRLASLYPDLLMDHERELLACVVRDESLRDSTGIVLGGVGISPELLRDRWEALNR